MMDNRLHDMRELEIIWEDTEDRWKRVTIDEFIKKHPDHNLKSHPLLQNEHFSCRISEIQEIGNYPVKIVNSLYKLYFNMDFTERYDDRLTTYKHPIFDISPIVNFGLATKLIRIPIKQHWLQAIMIGNKLGATKEISDKFTLEQAKKYLVNKHGIEYIIKFVEIKLKGEELSYKMIDK